MADLDYNDALHIDPDALDVELLRMGNLVADWGAKLAQAELAHQRAKASLSCVEAELACSVRSDPRRYGITGRVTNDIVTAVVVLRDEFIHAQDVVHEAQYNRDVLKSAVDGLKCKRDSLRDLVDLAKMRYFATPDEPRNLATSWDKFNSVSVRQLNEKLKGAQ